MNTPTRTSLGTPSFSRRALLAGGIGLSGAALLAACSRPSGAGGAGDGASGSIGWQLSWTQDYEFAGSYMADAKGYWKQEGLGVKMLPGGPNTNPQQIVAANQAFVASSKAVSAASLLVSDDIRLKIVGCLWQKYGLTVMSRSDNPIKVPKDLEGKTVGVFASNDNDWQAFLTLNGVDRSKIKEVPGSYDITPVASGTVDAVQGYGSTRVAQVSSSVALETMLLADFGYNPISAAYAVREETLQDKDQRKQLVKFLRGEARGWQDIAFGGEIDRAVDLTVNTYGKNLGLKKADQLAGLTGELDFVVTEDSKKNGLLTMSDTLISGTQDVLDQLGIKADINDIVTTEILDEVYDGKNRA